MIFNNFINKQAWKVAKSMPEIPHEYICVHNLDEQSKQLYWSFAKYISKTTANSFVAHFGNYKYKYIKHNGYLYWVMGIIINRCKISDYDIIENEFGVKYISRRKDV